MQQECIPYRYVKVKMITVGDKKQGACGIYVGRPSPLGNPFPLHREVERAAVIRDYKDWLAEQGPCVVTEPQR